MQRTLYDMIWSDHLVVEEPDGTCLLYVDRHIVHEVDSPQAFGGLRRAGLAVRAPEKTLLVVDHNVPTSDRTKPNPDPESEAQIAYFAENAKLFGLEYYNEFDKRQGICHVVGPEQGFTLPGTMLVCGDSHTSTDGAFGALAPAGPISIALISGHRISCDSPGALSYGNVFQHSRCFGNVQARIASTCPIAPFVISSMIRLMM